MNLILSITDFENSRTMIAVNPSQEIDLDDYIHRVEKDYLPKLFGKELYDLFVADWLSPIEGQPTATRFGVVYEPFIVQNDSVLIQSEGIKEMLKCFVYYLYLRDSVTRVSTVGIERVKGENSDQVNAINHDITSRYNEGVDIFRTIQHYMKSFQPIDYPEYNGVGINIATIF